jgi:hypothetical protein
MLIPCLFQNFLLGAAAKKRTKKPEVTEEEDFGNYGW